MAKLDWSQCPAVESLQAGATIEEIMEWFHATREQVLAVLEFAARSLDAPAPVQSAPETVEAIAMTSREGTAP